MRLIGEAVQKRGGKARFADPGLPGKEDHLTFAALRQRPTPQQQVAFFFPPDEQREAGSVQRSEGFATELARSAAQTRAGLAIPLRSLVPRS